MVGTRVYVGGLPYGVRDRDIERFFKSYGRIRDILIKNGYGFVVSKTWLMHSSTDGHVGSNGLEECNGFSVLNTASV